MTEVVFRWHAEVGSTNTLALAAASRGAEPWQVWLTDHQTAGRGRLTKEGTRDWVEKPGTSLLMSLLVHTGVPQRCVPRITLVAGVACAETLRSVSGLNVVLKWPNDLLVGSHKLGGILVESAAGTRPQAVVVGIGINVNVARSELPSEVAVKATSILAEAHRTFDRLTLATALVAKLRDCLNQFELQHGELGELADRWRGCGQIGGRRIEMPDGGEGTTRGLADDGSLLVQGDDGELHRVFAGEPVWL